MADDNTEKSWWDASVDFLKKFSYAPEEVKPVVVTPAAATQLQTNVNQTVTPVQSAVLSQTTVQPAASTATPLQPDVAAVAEFKPDVPTKAAMDYICNDVFPSIGISISDSSNLQDFQSCYTQATGLLKTLANLSDDPSKHADELKASLDAVAKSGEFKMAAMVGFIPESKINELFKGNPPQAVLNNPKLLISMVENRDKIVESIRQVNASGVLDSDKPQIAVNPIQATPIVGPTPAPTQETQPIVQTITTDTTVTTSTDNGPIDPQSKEAKDAMQAVETLLLKPFGDAIGTMGGQFGAMAEKFVDFKTLTNDDLTDGQFADEQFRLVMMGMRTLNGEKNASGTYDPSQRSSLIQGILGKEEFAMVRQKLDEQVNVGVTDQDKIKKNREAVLNGMFNQMDILYRAGLTDSEEAKNDTVYNRILSKASEWLPEGMKSFLKDFFTNNSFGKMLAGPMSAMGIQVGLLWGEKPKSEVELAQDARPMIEEGFADKYKEAKGDTPADKLTAMRTEAKDDLDGFVMGTVNKLLFKGADKDFLEQTVMAAFDKADAAAANGASAEEINKAFTDHMMVSAEEFKANPNNERTQSFSGIPDSEKTSILAETHKIVDEAGKEYDHLIKMGEGNKLAFTFNEIAFDNVTIRYAGDAPNVMYGVIGNNFDKLGMSQDIGMIQKSNGEYGDYFTPKGNGMIEELLIRAHIHDHLENGGELDKAFVDKISGEVENVSDPGGRPMMPYRELSLENLPLVTAYMTAKGVSAEDVTAFETKVTELGNNMRGTVPGKPDAGVDQNDSVLEHTLYGGQLDVGMIVAEMKPEPAVVVVPKPEEKPEPVVVKVEPAAKPEPEPVVVKVEPQAEPQKPAGMPDDALEELDRKTREGEIAFPKAEQPAQVAKAPTGACNTDYDGYRLSEKMKNEAPSSGFGGFLKNIFGSTVSGVDAAIDTGGRLFNGNPGGPRSYDACESELIRQRTGQGQYAEQASVNIENNAMDTTASSYDPDRAVANDGMYIPGVRSSMGLGATSTA